MMTFLSRAKARIVRKLRSNAGESLPETLIGMLIACLATVALVAMTLSASSSAANTRAAFENVCDQETAVALSTPAEAGQAGNATAKVGTGSVTISVGGASKNLSTDTFATDDFSYYQVAAKDKATGSQSLTNGGA